MHVFQNFHIKIAGSLLQFPPLCIFETLNYTVVLANESLRELVVLQKSVTSPPESITETITSGIVANSNYSVVVLAETDVWKATTTPYNFSESLKCIQIIL